MIEVQGGEQEIGQWRDHVVRAARSKGFSEADAWDIASAVFEACANAVHHGAEGSRARVTLTVHASDDRFQAVVQDAGRGFTCSANTSLPAPTSHRGRGIPLMRTLMDEVRFESNGGCKVTLTKRLPHRDGP